MHLQQVDALRPEALKRAIKARLPATAATEKTARRQLGRKKYPLANAQRRERIADQCLAVPICGRGVDDRAAQLAHAFDLVPDRFALGTAKGIRAQSNRG